MKPIFLAKLGILTLLLCLFNLTLADSPNDVEFDPLTELQKLTQQELVGVQAKIATGIKQPTDHSPAIATVITAEDIEAMGATDLDEVLETVPGLHVARSHAPNNPIYLIRGIYSDFNAEVLVLINGISIEALLTGNRGQIWGGMPVNAIARIEVIRGPGSALYGADAFAGVINIITKTKEDIEGTEVGLRVGSFDTRDAWLLHGGQWKGFDLALTLEYHDTAGFREIIESDIQTYYDNLFGTHASWAPGPVNVSRRSYDLRLDVARDKWRLRAGYQGRRNLGIYTGATQALDPYARWLDNRYNADLTYHDPHLTADWDVTAQVSVYQSAWGPTQDQYFYPPGAFGGAFPEGVIGQPGVGERQSRLNLVGVYSGFQKHTLRLGSGYYYGDLYNTHDFMNTDAVTGAPLPPSIGLVDYGDTPYVFQPEMVRKSWNWFLQDVWAFASDWELTTGIRYDHYSDFGATINPRLALVWRTNPAFTTKFLYGRAFRAPTLNQLFATNNAMMANNPQLQPQTIDTGEIALNYHASDTLDLMTNLFIYKIGDAIRYRQSPERLYGNSIPFVPQNLGSQTGHGLELVAKWVPKASFNLIGNYAYQTAIDENDHDPGYAPNHHIYLRTDWQFWPYWYWDTQVNWVGERPRPSDDTRPPLEGYATVDLTLRHKYLKDHWDFALSARNVFDADVREPSPGAGTTGIIGLPNDLPQAGRSIWLEMKYHF